MEGVFNDFETRGIGGDDLHHIETEGDIRHIKHAQPGHGAAHDQALFVAVHGVEWPAGNSHRAGFDFHEHQCGFPDVAADQVHFAPPPRPEVAPQDSVAIACKVCRRGPFSPAPQSGGITRIGKRLGIRAKSFCDESAKAHDRAA